MNCPYCSVIMEKGTMEVDAVGCITLVYRSDEDAKKKGFIEKLKTNPIVLSKYKRDKEEAYYCKQCMKVITIYDQP